MNAARVLFASLIVGIWAVSASAGIIYVKQDSQVTKPDGKRWSTAFQKVQDGLDAAVAGDDVWVAKGKYVEQITLKSDVDLYGGFAGTETSIIQRPWNSKSTLDGGSQGTVVTCYAVSSKYQYLDGFVVTNGKRSPAIPQGGGMCISSGKLVVNRCEFTGNEANQGGAIYSSTPSLAIFCTSFNANKAVYAGGGIYQSSNSSASPPPTFAGCVFDGNSALEGSAICVASPIGLGANAQIFNNTIIHNTATVPHGGAVYLESKSGYPSNYLVLNNIVAFNSAGISASLNSPGLIVGYNCASGNREYAFWNLTADSTNIFADPKLADCEHGDYHLTATSPCVDKGGYISISSLYAQCFLDIDGSSKTMCGPTDIGADEYLPVMRVANGGSSANSGLTWDRPLGSLDDALVKFSHRGCAEKLEVWLKAGTYQAGMIYPADSLQLYGGFAGNETQRNQRDWVKNKTTIMSGLVLAVNQHTPITIDGFCIDGAGAGAGSDGIRCAEGDYLICNNTISGCKGSGIAFEDTGYPYYKAGLASARIVNNTINGNNTSRNAYCAGILCHAKDTCLEGNTIAGNGCFGVLIKTTGAENAVVLTNNLISKTSGDSYNPGVGVGMNNGSTVSAINNLLTDNSYGIKVIDDHVGVVGSLTAKNNTIANNPANPGKTGILVTAPAQASIVNNIVAHNSVAGIWLYKQSTVSTNCFYNPKGSNSNMPLDQTNILADPKFLDPVGDYHLNVGSPCIDAAVDDQSITTDIEGTPRPKDGNGDGIGKSDIGCYECPANYVSLSSLKSLKDDAPVGIFGVVVTASLPDRCYVESENRLFGIAVNGSYPSIGKRVSMEGYLSTVDGERMFFPTWIGEYGSALVPKPWYVNCNSLGGGPNGLQAGVKDWRMVRKTDDYGHSYLSRELTSFGGANNIGLLVKMTGRVVNSNVPVEGPVYFYIDGAAAFYDGSNNGRGVLVDWPFESAPPAEGSLVSILGISSCHAVYDENSAEVIVRMLRPVSADAVSVLK